MTNETVDELEKKLLEKAIRKRDLLVRSIQRVCTNIENMEVDDENTKVTLEAAKIDRDDLEKKLNEFQEVQSQIEMDIEDDQLDEHENERTRVENIARSAKIVLADYIANHSELAGVGNGSSRRSMANTEAKTDRKVKRPEIQIPKFEGDYRKWTDFKNVFESLVVNDEAYTNVEKMVYLKQAMQKSVADVIRKYEITDKSFEKAWDKLRKRYENRRATINTHLQSLTQLPAAKTEAGLQKLLDAASDAIESLDSMGVKNGWSCMLAFLITEKLDNETRRAWEIETVKESEYPGFEKLEPFLQQRIRVTESMGNAVARTSAITTTTKKPDTTKSFAVRRSMESGNSELRCFDCQENHPIAECEKFAARTILEKTEIIKRKGLCFQCLGKGHMVITCRAARCSKCSKRHHLLLHVESEKSSSIGSDKINQDGKETKKSFCTQSVGTNVILPTALVVACQGSRKTTVRTYLDSCSQPNLVAESLARRLKCISRKSNVVITTAIPGTLEIDRVCRIRVESRSRNYWIEADFQIAPFISDDYVAFDTSKVKNKNLDFADSVGVGGSQVEMLIGAEFYEAIMLAGKLQIEEDLFLRETLFGWVVIGATQVGIVSSAAKCCLTIEDQLQRFFVLEEVENSGNGWTSEEVKCDKHFETTHRWDESGFDVALPRELPVEFLSESRRIAFRQFCALEKRLSSEEFIVYKGFMDEYIHLGHMTKVEEPENSAFRCYLPHHVVYKKSSTTTRMRSVFNASCPTSTGYSLNDILMKGPVLQDDLFSILIRFRCVKVVFTADIEKMYRQVRVRKEDRALQCILWRDNSSEPIRTYELNTVTYGTKPASYLATKCLRKIADKYDSEMPETATILRRDFYMDDVLTGSNSVRDARERLQELRQVLGSAGFPLRKFASNSDEVLDGLDKELIEGALEFENGECSIGVLGMRWLTAEDRFAFYARLPEQPISWTKREILSEVSKIFDPLGLLAPLVITLKILLQSLWADKLGWDEPVDEDVAKRYGGIRSELQMLPSIHISRLAGEASECEFHIFCDASEKAYGAAVYLRHLNDIGVEVRLLCAKTRVAPLKKVSLPRLELCAAVLGAKLFEKVRAALALPDSVIVKAWSDSMIVLSWLAKPEFPWVTFVANRVTKVTESLPSNLWSHVKSQENAADVISRGIEPGKFQELERFVNGPEFLYESELATSEVEFDERALNEKKGSNKVLLTTTYSWSNEFFNRFSSYGRLIRSTAYLLRFVENSALEKECRNFDSLSVTEINCARILLIKLAQKTMDRKKLDKIDHFIDGDGLYRLRGRMANAEMSERAKYPILLPKCRFLKLLIEFYHCKFYHADCSFLKHFLTAEYFVLVSLSKMIRSVVYNCVTCRRYASRPLEFQIPVGQLPKVRVCTSSAFMEVGVDFAGPFTTRAVGPSGNRGKVFFKSYIAVFVCMASKACHLEVVEDLSTKSFLDSFSRFLARRGMCATVYSDNGTNFAGAERELRAAYEFMHASRKDIEEFSVNHGINWKFIPQRAPNFGGLWEAAVKSFKTHFRKVVGNQILSFVELFTLVTQIEAILNSRPICATDSLSDSFLTPSHLCIGRSLLTLPPAAGEVITGGALARYRLIRGILDRFWSVWRNEYLVSLRKATVRVIDNRIPSIGELVLVKDEATSPCNWPLARIVKLYFGQDKVARVADVKLGSRILRRPIIKLVSLFHETPSSHGGGVC